MHLESIIKEKIKEKGPISFHDFMELALYHPELGYYNTSTEKIGKNGDYYTSPVISPVFGELIGKQLEQMWALLGKEPFTIVEYGAGTGCLCNSILNSLKQNEKMYATLRYCIIEKSSSLQKKQKEFLPEKVSWHNSIEDIGEICGCVLSNEVADNFATHRIGRNGDLQEIHITEENGLKEISSPASVELSDYFAELRIDLPHGSKAEINLEARSWMDQIATHLERGYFLTIDYGGTSAELYHSNRKDGTLACFQKHKINYSPYANIGEQDITSYVNFSALCLWGYKSGLTYSGYTDQGRFLHNLGFREHLKKTGSGDLYKDYKREIDLTSKLIGDMGAKFKVLIMQKNVPDSCLIGLR